MKARILSIGTVLLFLPSLVSPVILLNEAPPFPKRIALTFDDGPKPEATQNLLEVLERHDVVGTFFVVGKMAQRHPRTLTLIHQSGHEIAGHSWSHPSIEKISPEKFKKELDRTRRLIFKLTGVDTSLFRSPGSTRHYIEKKFKTPKGYELVLWDIHSMDHAHKDVDAISNRIQNQAKDGAIVLLHNGIRETVDALDCFIPILKSRGYHFVTVSELKQPSPLWPS